MIQRIQSLFLLLSAIVTIVLLFIPIGYVYTDEARYVFDCFSVKIDIPDGGIYMNTFSIALLLIASAILSVVSVFRYKNRKQQLSINSINMILFLIAILLMVYVYPDILFTRKGLIKDGNFFRFNYWIMIFIVPAISMFLANRFIRKDEKLIKAADRLRG